MIIEQVVGNVADIDLAGRHLEKVYVNSDDLVKRIQRISTDHGKELGIRLRQSKDLKNGDILYMDDRNAIVIQVLEDDLLVIRPLSLMQMGEIAHQLGNRHLPAQFTETEMLVQYDYLVEALLQQLGIPYDRENRQVKEAFRHIGHHHG